MLRSKGTVRTLRGQSYLRRTIGVEKFFVILRDLFMNYLPDPIWQTGCLRFDNGACTNRHNVRETNESKEIKLKTLNLLISCFFIHTTKQNAGMLGRPLKLHVHNCRRSKVRLTCSMPLRPNERISLAFYAPSQIFLREFHKPTAW